MDKKGKTSEAKAINLLNDVLKSKAMKPPQIPSSKSYITPAGANSSKPAKSTSSAFVDMLYISCQKELNLMND